MFLDDAYVIDSYNRKVLKVSNDVSTELFNLEKEDIITDNKDYVSIDEDTKNLIKKYLKISDTEIEKIVNRKDSTTKKKERSGYSSILVSQDKVSLFITNRITNHLYHYKKDAISGEFSLFQKIRVGKKPVACCEDPNGNIYVANYGDNTVSKVEIPTFKSKLLGNEEAQDKVVKTMVVSAGPRSIVSDEEGTIWVACYLSHKIDPINDTEIGGIVNKIVNATVVDQIVVGNNPSSITCDINNTIWVANAGSNTVSRIVKSKRIVDFEVGPRPMAIVNDSFGNVYVANYEGNSVTMIETSSKAIAAGDNITTIPVGEGPNAIDINSKDEILVVCGLGNIIYKIYNKKVISTIRVCDSPVAIGDFTGCATYNKLNIMAKDEESDKKDKELNDIIEKAKTTSEEIEDLKSKVSINTENIEGLKNNTSLKTEFDEFKNTVNTNIETINTSKASKEDLDTFKSETNIKIEEAKANAISPEDRTRIGYIDTLKENMVSKDKLASLMNYIDILNNKGLFDIEYVEITYDGEHPEVDSEGNEIYYYYIIKFYFNTKYDDYTRSKLPSDFQRINNDTNHPIVFSKDNNSVTATYDENTYLYTIRVKYNNNGGIKEFPFGYNDVKVSCYYETDTYDETTQENIVKPIYSYMDFDSRRENENIINDKKVNIIVQVGTDAFLEDENTLDFITHNGKVYPNLFYKYDGSDHDAKTNHYYSNSFVSTFTDVQNANKIMKTHINYERKTNTNLFDYESEFPYTLIKYNNFRGNGISVPAPAFPPNLGYDYPKCGYMFIMLWINEDDINGYAPSLLRGSTGFNNLRVQLDNSIYYFEPYPKELIQDEKYKDYHIYYSKLNKPESANGKDQDIGHNTIVKIFLK
nr:MAG TPA: NHL protein [Caudoviricetes sp.]